MSERTRRERVEEVRGYKYIRMQSGRLMTFWNALAAAERAETDLARAVSRALKLAGTAVGDGELEEYDLQRLEWFIDGLATYIGAVREAIEERRGVKSEEERIALLRNTAGRTPEEAAAYQRKADELERRLSR